MSIEERARKVRLIVLDCDGVLTDGGLWYDEDGRITKRFDVQDGLGIKAGQHAGLEFAVISGLDHAGVARRVKELGIRHYFAGHVKKLPILECLCGELGIGMGQIAYMGDDWVDMLPMRHVGLPLAVPDAQPEVRELAAWVSAAPGGRGAVREAVMMILKAQGAYALALRNWSG